MNAGILTESGMILRSMEINIVGKDQYNCC